MQISDQTTTPDLFEFKTNTIPLTRSRPDASLHHNGRPPRKPRAFVKLSMSKPQFPCSRSGNGVHPADRSFVPVRHGPCFRRNNERRLLKATPVWTLPKWWLLCERWSDNFSVACGKRAFRFWLPLLSDFLIDYKLLLPTTCMFI